MMPIVLVIIIGLIGGISVGIQSPLAGAMGQRLGGMASSFIIHLSGLLLSGGLLILRGGENIKQWSSLPWYMLLTGFFGVLLFQTFTVTLPRLGSTMMVVLLITGQLLVGLLIDHFGWLGVRIHPIDLTRVLGAIALLAGGYLIAK